MSILKQITYLGLILNLIPLATTAMDNSHPLPGEVPAIAQSKSLKSRGIKLESLNLGLGMRPRVPSGSHEASPSDLYPSSDNTVDYETITPLSRRSKSDCALNKKVLRPSDKQLRMESHSPRLGNKDKKRKNHFKRRISSPTVADDQDDEELYSPTAIADLYAKHGATLPSRLKMKTETTVSSPEMPLSEDTSGCPCSIQ